MTEIATEDDLWKLFWGKPPKNGHKKKGEGFIFYGALRQVLDAKSFGENGKCQLTLEDEKKRYLVCSIKAKAVVRQCDLRSVAQSMNRGAGDVFVGYLGIPDKAPA